MRYAPIADAVAEAADPELIDHQHLVPKPVRHLHTYNFELNPR